MPRDGSQNYVLPFPDVVSSTTIASPVYNGFTNDVAQDLNAPRPITAGGTGATSAAGALAALGGEMAQQVVTNYDSHPFVSGSFYSETTATGSPVAGHNFMGICYMKDANNGFIEARDFFSDNSEIYLRWKETTTGWGPWSTADYAMDAKKVNRAGDTMTNTLGISVPADMNMHLRLDAANGQHKYMRATNASSLEWVNNANNNVIASLSDGGTFNTMGGYQIGNTNVVTKGSGYNYFCDGEGTSKLILGGSPDPTNYLRNSNHSFQDIGATVTWALVNSAGFTVNTGLYAVTPTAPDNSTRVPTTNWVRGYAHPLTAGLYPGIPTVPFSNGYVTVASDAQKLLWNSASAAGLTINGGLYGEGTVISFMAWSGTMTIANTEGMTALVGGTTVSGTRTLAQYGMATAIRFSGPNWVISGNGLT